ncbi:MAG: esterase-like activity of phytase family protein [Candidatus Competibacterales bacterium]
MANQLWPWLSLTLVFTPVCAQERFPAELAGHAYLPAATFINAPADAPALFHTSGKFAGPGNTRNDKLYSVEGSSFLSAPDVPRTTGLRLPFVGQPVQGFSGIKHMENGEYMVLVDNGFGSKANSVDAMLQFHRLRPNWETGQVEMLASHFLSDPHGLLPFPITTEGTATRYLTGADFDLEGMQPVGEQIWFGDEFGPYVFATDLEGRVVAFFDTTVDGDVVRSPDNHGLRMPSTPGEVSFAVRRSRGFEGMAAAVDGSALYPLFEGPLWDAEQGDWENQDSRQYLRIIEFDIASQQFTDRQWKYLLEENGHNIGDFNMIDAERGLIIERDGGEGDAALACEGEAQPDCFNNPAGFKRVYLVDFSQADADGFVKKVGYVDLLAIDDPQGIARVGGGEGRFSFPFVTIEDVDRVDDEHIVVANDNNLPFSSGRTIGQNDHNEFILLRVPELLSAR